MVYNQKNFMQNKKCLNKQVKYYLHYVFEILSLLMPFLITIIKFYFVNKMFFDILIC